MIYAPWNSKTIFRVVEKVFSGLEDYDLPPGMFSPKFERSRSFLFQGKTCENDGWLSSFFIQHNFHPTSRIPDPFFSGVMSNIYDEWCRPSSDTTVTPLISRLSSLFQQHEPRFIISLIPVIIGFHDLPSVNVNYQNNPNLDTSSLDCNCSFIHNYRMHQDLYSTYSFPDLHDMIHHGTSRLSSNYQSTMTMKKFHPSRIRHAVTLIYKEAQIDQQH